MDMIFPWLLFFGLAVFLGVLLLSGMYFLHKEVEDEEEKEPLLPHERIGGDFLEWRKGDTIRVRLKNRERFKHTKGVLHTDVWRTLTWYSYEGLSNDGDVILRDQGSDLPGPHPSEGKLKCMDPDLWLFCNESLLERRKEADQRQLEREAESSYYSQYTDAQREEYQKQQAQS